MPKIDSYHKQVFTHISDILMNPVKENTWFEKNRPIFEEELLNKGNINPEKIFIIIDAIEYETEDESVQKGPKKTIGINEWSLIERVPKTGHVRPKIQFTENTFTKNDYQKILHQFDLLEDDRIPPEKYPQIVAFKNTQEQQFTRQASVVVKLHQLIAEELGSLYANLEAALLEKQRQNQPNDYGNVAPDGWTELVLELRSIFNQIQYGMTPDKIKQVNRSDSLFQHTIVPSNLCNETSERIMKHCRKREPIIEVLRVLVKKILPLESLIEDFNFDQPIKSIRSIREKEAYKDMPDPANFAKDRASRNKDKEGSNIKVMTAAIKLLRTHLVEKNYTSLDGKVNGIATYLIDNTKGLKSSQKTTVGEWVKSYFEGHKAMKMNRLNKN